MQIFVGAGGAPGIAGTETRVRAGDIDYCAAGSGAAGNVFGGGAGGTPATAGGDAAAIGFSGEAGAPGGRPGAQWLPVQGPALPAGAVEAVQDPRAKFQRRVVKVVHKGVRRQTGPRPVAVGVAATNPASAERVWSCSNIRVSRLQSLALLRQLNQPEAGRAQPRIKTVRVRPEATSAAQRGSAVQIQRPAARLVAAMTTGPAARLELPKLDRYKRRLQRTARTHGRLPRYVDAQPIWTVCQVARVRGSWARRIFQSRAQQPRTRNVCYVHPDPKSGQRPGDHSVAAATQSRVKAAA